MRIANWGNYPVVEAEVGSFDQVGEAAAWLARDGESIVRGMGRSYGDASLSHRILSGLRLNRILSFDALSGHLLCEAGVTFDDLLRVFVPRGWFPPVTPGTRHVTLGGAVAADVHGKNHHWAGSLGRHVSQLTLLTPAEGVVVCDREQHADLFRATVGGMGLTGVILLVALRLIPLETAFVVQESRPARDLAEIMELFAASAEEPYSVAWIDCLARGRKLGRSVLLSGHHATRGELPAEMPAPLLPDWQKKRNIPFHFPEFALSPPVVRLFNSVYHRRFSGGPARSLQRLETFFYPLDGIEHWNRIYGRRGFLQYQFVLPLSSSRRGLEQILGTIADSSQGSFLAVLKQLGPAEGMLSFPMPGFTLALDFPATPRVFGLLSRLDHMVCDHGGRIYLAKDARMAPTTFFAGYPQAEAFRAVKRRWDPDNKLVSRLAHRLGLV